jgi:hypothetical protein
MGGWGTAMAFLTGESLWDTVGLPEREESKREIAERRKEGNEKEEEG